jgi:hypothetical protein
MLMACYGRGILPSLYPNHAASGRTAKATRLLRGCAGGRIWGISKVTQAAGVCRDIARAGIVDLVAEPSSMTG